jgi:hypothetical protein
LELRSELFKQPELFYNAGGTVPNAKGYAAFVNRIPAGREPKIIIVGIDQSYFNPKWTAALMDADTLTKGNTALSRADIVSNAARRTFFDIVQGKIPLSFVWTPVPTTTIGLNAIVHKEGTRGDGSRYYGAFLHNPHNPENQDYELKDTFNRIEKGRTYFEYGQHISPDALKEFELFLEACNKRGIQVIGFLPPYAHAVYEKMKARGRDYAFMNEIMPALQGQFKKFNYPLFDFTDLLTTGASDKEIIDGLHGSEKAYVRMVIVMAEKTPLLKERIDVPWLKEMLKKSPNDFEVFGDNF